MKLTPIGMADLNRKGRHNNNTGLPQHLGCDCLEFTSNVRITQRARALEIRVVDHTRIGMSTYSAGDLSFSRIRVGALASARCTSTVSPSIWPRMSSR